MACTRLCSTTRTESLFFHNEEFLLKLIRGDLVRWGLFDRELSVSLLTKPVALSDSTIPFSEAALPSPLNIKTSKSSPFEGRA